MALSDSENKFLIRARRSHQLWKVVRVLLIPAAFVSVALGLNLAGTIEFSQNPLTKYLMGLLILIGVGILSLVITGWSDSTNRTLIALLEEKVANNK